MNSGLLPSTALAIRRRLRDDYEFFAGHCLLIRTKADGLKSLKFNRAQAYIHEQAEDQKRRTGRVRKIVLKGRQQGCSTYIEGRAYHYTSNRRGVRAFILTHEGEATNNLFEMAQRYHDNAPVFVKPSTSAANAKELIFDILDSGYKVGTAGSKGTGRSQTVQFFHGSEVAYWPNAETHAAGVMQAIPDAPDTEAWLESTADGMGNYFHQQWVMAQRGESEFEPIFVPWFWQPEYRKVDNDFVPTPDEDELADRFGLDTYQLAWRRAKISELGSLDRFHQEYPCTPEEAFQASVDDVVIDPALIRAAAGRDVAVVPGRVVWGLDVARFGSDRCSLAKRKTNHLLEAPMVWAKKDTVQTAGIVMAEYKATPAALRPDDICVDVIGIGAGVADQLRAWGLPAIDVNVAEGSSRDDRYMRLRDELWFAGQEWFASKHCAIPDGRGADGQLLVEPLIVELSTPKFAYTATGKRQVEPKDKMKQRVGWSPDLADAFLLTFATSDMPAHQDTAPDPDWSY